MALSTFIKNATNGILKVIDLNAVTLTIPYEKGDFAVDNFKRVLNEVVKMESRGRLKGTAIGGRVYPAGSFSAWITEFTNAAVGVLPAFFLRSGGYSAVASTAGANHPVDKYHLEWVVEGTAFGDDADMTLRFEDCHFTSNIAEAIEGNSLSFSFECQGRILLNGSVIAQEVQ